MYFELAREAKAGLAVRAPEPVHGEICRRGGNPSALTVPVGLPSNSQKTLAVRRAAG